MSEFDPAQDFQDLHESVRLLHKDVRCLHLSMQKYQPYLEMAIERERLRAVFQQAVIEKTVIALVWSAIAGLGLLIYHGTVAYLHQITGSGK